MSSKAGTERKQEKRVPRVGVDNNMLRGINDQDVELENVIAMNQHVSRQFDKMTSESEKPTKRSTKGYIKRKKISLVLL